MNKKDKIEIAILAQKVHDLIKFEEKWKDDWDKKYENHEERIRVNEEFRQNVKGASMLLGVIVTILGILSMLYKFGVF